MVWYFRGIGLCSRSTAGRTLSGPRQPAFSGRMKGLRRDLTIVGRSRNVMPRRLLRIQLIQSDSSADLAPLCFCQIFLCMAAIQQYFRSLHGYLFLRGVIEELRHFSQLAHTASRDSDRHIYIFPKSKLLVDFGSSYQVSSSFNTPNPACSKPRLFTAASSSMHSISSIL